MRYILLLAILFQVNGNLSARTCKDKLHQFQVNDSIISFFGKEPDGSPIIHYYKFYDGIQMIEFDYLTPYHERINYLEQAQPRALSWQMVLGPPHPNVYLFRNEAGTIVKSFGMVGDEAQLLSVEKSKEIAKAHNSFGTVIGSRLGFSGIGTRYFPYYILGGSSDFDSNTGALGLIDSLGNVVLPQSYDVIWQHDQLFITRKGNLNELRDNKLKVIYSSNEYTLQPSERNSNCADIYIGDKFGLMNSKGEIIVPCKYDMLVGGFYQYGLAEVRRDGLTGFVNKKGEEVIECKYQSVGEFTEGLLNVRLNNKWGYVDSTGKTIIPHKYDIGISFYEGFARVALKENYTYQFGYINKEDQIIIPLTFSNAKDFHGGKAEVMIENKWVKINKKGERVR
jgi:hypothetical protein